METTNNIVCPKCNIEMRRSKAPEYSRKLQTTVIWFYECKCGVTAVSNHGDMNYYDIDGHVIMSGK